jgi:hypothetical protein
VASAGSTRIRGAKRTVSVAAVLVATPNAFVTTTENFAASSAGVVGSVVKDVPVAPGMSIPSFRHWYERGAVPVAATVKVATAGSVTVVDNGCVVMTGTSCTVSKAFRLVVLPTAFDATTVKIAPSSTSDVGPVVNERPVAPEMGDPFLRHWYVGVGFPVALTVKVAVTGASTVASAGSVVIRGA